MNTCKKCQRTFPDRIVLNGKTKTVHKRKVCVECEPIGFSLREKRKEIERRKLKKQCKKCKEEKATYEFHKDVTSPDGFHRVCKFCRLALRKIFYAKNRDRLKNWFYSYRKSNPEKIKATQIKSRPKTRKRLNERYKNDVCFKLKTRLRTRLRSAIQEVWASGSFVQDLGCSINELKTYLESKFYANPKTGEKMTWDNWKKDGWHVDHVKALASFNLSNKDEFLKACHFTNLQPLWWFENLSKGKK